LIPANPRTLYTDLYEDQFAQTIAALLGFHFTAEHPIAEPVRELLAK
jgi:hypothetical protein